MGKSESLRSRDGSQGPSFADAEALSVIQRNRDKKTEYKSVNESGTDLHPYLKLITPAAGDRNIRSGLLSNLYAEHQQVLRLLEVLEELIIGNVSDIKKRLFRAHTILDYLNCLRHHHVEDMIAANLLERSVISPQMHSKLKLSHDALKKKSQKLLKTIGLSLKVRRTGKELDALVLSFADKWREHINDTEAELFVKAERVFTNRDWHQLSATCGIEASQLFNGEVSERYEDLFQYLRNRVIHVSTVSGSLNPIKVASTLLEKLEAVAWGCEELQQALTKNSRQMLRRQNATLKRLSDTKGLDAFIKAIGSWTSTSLNDGCTILKSPGIALLKAGHILIVPPRKSFAHVVNIHKQTNAISGYKRRSTRVYALNLLLRVFLKQAVRRASVDTLNRLLMPMVNLVASGLPSNIKNRDAGIGSLNAEWIEPTEVSSKRVVLYIPGGAFMFPATQHHRVLVARLASSLKARCLLVHYRLAPAHRHPDCLEDCVKAYHHLLEQGVDPACIVLAGDSAGGGLVLSTMLALRDAGKPLPAAAVLLSPLADLTYSGSSRTYNRWCDPMLPTSRTVDLNEVLLKDIPASHPLVSPIFGDYSGFPPILAQVGSDEMLLDDTLRMASQARSQAVLVQVEVWQEMPHVWQLIQALAESALAVAHIETFINRHVGAFQTPNPKSAN